MASQPIYQFYAALDDFMPRIWRRFQVPQGITVARLGYILQVLFEMTASHLMAFEVPEGKNFRAAVKKEHPDLDEAILRDICGDEKDDRICRYELMHGDFEALGDPRENVDTFDMVESSLRQAVFNLGDKMAFCYDFGDDWRVSLTLENVFTDKELPGSALPRVLEGAGFGIVEDVGGVWGLGDLVKAFGKKKGDTYDQYSEWLGVTEFDIMAFDLEDMNFRLKKIPRIYKESYEDGYEPTQRSIDLIERKYKK